MDENGYGFTCTDYEVISEDGSSKNKIINMPKVINYRLYLKNTIIPFLKTVYIPFLPYRF